VKSTAKYYVPYSTKTYPPKPPDTEIPIIGKMPTAPHETIGRLAFSTDQGWSFLRRSMIYNAQAQGADLVVLKNVTTKRQLILAQVPAQWNYFPVQNFYRGKNGQVYSTTTWLPSLQPGYTQPYMDEITAIDADLVIMKK